MNQRKEEEEEEEEEEEKENKYKNKNKKQIVTNACNRKPTIGYVCLRNDVWGNGGGIDGMARGRPREER